MCFGGGVFVDFDFFLVGVEVVLEKFFCFCIEWYCCCYVDLFVNVGRCLFEV